MKVDKAIDAMRHLLMKYGNEREHIHKDINAYVNTSDQFEMTELIEMLDTNVSRDAILEHKMSIMSGFLTQLLTQVNALANVAAPPADENA